MPSASRTVDIAAPPAQFLAVLQDYARYPEFLPEVKWIHVEQLAPDTSRVTYALDAKIMLVEYALDHVQSGPWRIDWKLVRGDMFRLNSGHWQLEPHGENSTRATYTIELQLGSMPPSLARALVDKGLPSLLEHFKTRAEALWSARK